MDYDYTSYGLNDLLIALLQYYKIHKSTDIFVQQNTTVRNLFPIVTLTLSFFSERDIKPTKNCFYNFNKKLESICIRPDHNQLIIAPPKSPPVASTPPPSTPVEPKIETQSGF